MLPVLLMALAAVGILAFSMDRGEASPAPPPPRPPPPLPPAPLPPPVSDAALLQRKWLIVKRSLELAANMRRQMLGQILKTESPATSLAVVKAHFVKQGIDVGLPSPAKPFWRQSEAAIALRATAAVNSMPKPVAAGAPVPVAPKPTVKK